MKVLITGASGFIGGHLAKACLLAGYMPIALLRLDSTYSELLETMETCQGLEALLPVDAVVHLAARVHQMKEGGQGSLTEFRKANVDYTMAVAKAALSAGAKLFIFLSTMKVYGESAGVYSEKGTPCPSDPYGKSKLEAEAALSELFASQDQAKLVIFRIPMVYGPGNKGNMLTLLSFARFGLPLPIGAATEKRSFLYVENLISAVLTVIQYDYFKLDKVGIWNIADEKDISSSELYRLICQALGKNVFLPRVSPSLFSFFGRGIRSIRAVGSRLFDQYQMETHSFRKRFGWRPPYSCQSGVDQTSDWFLKKHENKR